MVSAIAVRASFDKYGNFLARWRQNELCREREVELRGLVFVIEISMTKIKSQSESPTLSAQVFRGFPMRFFHCQARGRWRQASSVLFTHTPLNS